MKVILLRDVAKIGRRYDVVTVADGMASNKLIPRGDAKQATPENLKQVENLRTKGVTNKADLVTMLKTIADTFIAEPLVVKMSSNEKGHLFQGVKVDDIILSAKDRGVIVKREFLVVDNHLKSLGEFTVALKGEKTIFNFPIKVEAK